jgi:hypothetical protein
MGFPQLIWLTIVHGGFAMKKELSPKQILAVRCPTCGAAPGQKCELSTGQPRHNPHLDRRLISKDWTRLGGTWTPYEELR